MKYEEFIFAVTINYVSLSPLEWSLRQKALSQGDKWPWRSRVLLHYLLKEEEILDAVH